jgi:2-polyprenyl-3-methyl-5-hydroxy-6-metoxy-1,4-benzoquinol methylase
LVSVDPGRYDSPHHDYPEAYYRGGAYADYLTDRGAILRDSVRRLRYLERFVNRGSLLDAGCATGAFLEAARTRGWKVTGLDISEFAAEYARREARLDVYTGSITSPPAHLPRFDAITMWDTIEHIDRPDIAVKSAHNLLVPGGVLVISTGDFGSLLRRLTGSRWRLFSDETHRYFFDERTLTRLLSDRRFEVLDIRRSGKWVGSLMVLHQAGFSIAGRARDWLMARGWNPKLYLNPRDVMTVYARRRP